MTNRVRAAINALFAKGKPLGNNAVRGAASPFLEEDKGWKKIGGSARDYSLDAWDHSGMVKGSRRSFQRDAVARRWVRMKTAFTVGTEPVAQATSKDEATRDAVQAAIDEFQFDDVNQLPNRIPKYARNALSTGGLCLLLAGSEVEGATATRIGRVDQQDIQAAVTDPNNADLRIGILRCPTVPGTPPVVHPVVSVEGNVHPMFNGMSPGDVVALPAHFHGVTQTSQNAVLGLPCMYLALNDMSGQQLGISDLFPALDALQDYDDVTHGGLQRAIAALAYAHVRKVPQGTDQGEIDKLADSIGASCASGMGDVLVLTDDQTHEIMNPTLAGMDVKDAADVPFKTICIAAGFPPHWLAEPGDTNLATAGETAGPVIAMLKEDQAAFVGFFTAVITYALLRKPELLRLWEQDPANLAFDIAVPPLSGKDSSRAAQVFTSDLTALSELKSNGLTTAAYQREATKLANSYGFELEAEDWRDAAEVDDEASAFRSLFEKRDEPEDEHGDEGADDEGDEAGDRRAA